MNEEVAEVAEHPLALFVAFHAVRKLTKLLLHAKADFVRNRLCLSRIGTRADYEMIGKAGDSSQIENFDFSGLLVLRGPYCNQPARLRFLLGSITGTVTNFCLRQKLYPSRYRTIEVSVFHRFAAFAAVLLFVFSGVISAQTDIPAPAQEQASSSVSIAPSAVAPRDFGPNALQPDESDPSVRIARESLDRIQRLVESGALPRIRLRKAQDDVQDALDGSLLKKSLYSNDLLPEQAEQLIYVAQRMVIRRQRALLDMQQLVGAGIISRAEAESSGIDLTHAQQELDWAENRARLIQEMAAAVKLQKEIASLESQAESHPEWNGSVFTKYEGSGAFTPFDLKNLETAYVTRFSKPLPISANGETALHRSMGFDHRGRVDVAVYPETTEGLWLQSYLKSKRIPYFAFRAAVPHQATGAHIHVGPGSTKLSSLPATAHQKLALTD